MLPPGISLDSFTGTLTGIPTTIGTFNVLLRVRDYHETSDGITRPVTLTVASPPPVKLAITVSSEEAGGQTQIVLHGPTGQQQIIKVSNNLLDWTPVTTNTSGTNLFQFIENNSSQFQERFYRAVTAP